MQYFYSIFDAKASAYSAPFVTGADGLAIRSVTGAARDPNTALCQYPEDFSVYCVGTFDPVSGKCEPVLPPRHVANVTSLVFVVDQEKEEDHGSSFGNGASVFAGSESEDSAEQFSSPERAKNHF